jgi:3-oxoacyl-[acyl-carrier protein] reductase
MTTMGNPVAIISGGSRGIGRAVALRLAEDGFDVGLCYATDSEAAKRVENDVRDLGRNVYVRRADVSDAGQVRTLIAGVEDALGPISAVVASAAVVRDRPLALMEDDEWSRVLRVDLDGVYHLCRGTIEEMMRRKEGAIVTVSSVSGVRGNVGQTNYAAAKAGIIGFTKSLAQEVGRYGIRANVVVPGFISTEHVDGLPAALREQATSRIALRRFGHPDEVADLIAFLVGDRARYITGSVVTIDGGIQ